MLADGGYRALAMTMALLLGRFGRVIPRPCDLGMSDVLFVVQSSFDIDKYDFDDVKLLIRTFLEDMNINGEEKNTRVGVILFDRVREPEYRIKLGEIKQLGKLQKAIQSIGRLPCGYWWCQIKPQQTVTQAVDMAMGIFANESNPQRMKKLVVILNGKQYLPTIREINSLSFKDPLLRIAQVLVVPDITEADDPYYRYLLAYYQSYERYIGRLHQMYPNISLPNVQQTYNPYMQLPYSKEIKDGVIILQSYEFFCTIRSDICNLLFSCPPCSRTTTTPAAVDADYNPTFKESEKVDSNNMQTSPLDLPKNIDESEVLISDNSVSDNEQPITTESSVYDETIEDIEVKTTTSATVVEENKDKHKMSSTANKNVTGGKSNGEFSEPAVYVDYIDDNIIEDDNDSDDSDLVWFEKVKQLKNRTAIVGKKRHRRQTYQIYPIHSQQYCVCTADAEITANIEINNFNADMAEEADLPKTYLKAVQGCTQFADKADQTAECSKLNEIQDNYSILSKKLLLGPLSRNDFENCYELNISAVNCLRAKYVYMLNKQSTDSNQMEFNDDGPITTFDAPNVYSKTVNNQFTADVSFENSSQTNNNFEISVDKWLGLSSRNEPSSSGQTTLDQFTQNNLGLPSQNEVQFFNGVPSGSISTERGETFPNSQDYSEDISNTFTSNDQDVHPSEDSVDNPLINGIPKVVTIRRVVGEDSEEFVIEQPASVNTAAEEKASNNIFDGSGLPKTTGKIVGDGGEQSLVSLVDPESGTVPKIQPPTVKITKIKALKNRTVKVQDVKTKENITATTLDHLLPVNKIRPQRKSSKLLTNQELLLSFKKPSINQCILNGADIVVYIDDTETMSKNEFNVFRHFLANFYRTLEVDRRKCKEVSRLGIIKVDDDGKPFTYLEFNSAMNVLQKSVSIAKMPYAGCVMNTNEKCHRSIVDAYQLATKMQTNEVTDRAKVFIIATSRSRKQLRSLYFDLLEAIEQATNNGVAIFPVAIGNSYNDKALKALTTGNLTIAPAEIRNSSRKLAEWFCKHLSVPKDIITGKESYCPWKGDDI